jgi:hypothetical protein
MEGSMTLAFRKHVPGRADVNKAFNKENIQHIKDLYVQQQSQGGYHFGDLSALFVGLSAQERTMWDDEIASFYPVDVRDEIVRTIQAALFHKDIRGNEHPVPIRFDWIPAQPHGLSNGVRTTYNPLGPSYHIEIIGFPPPPGSLLARRRKNQQLQPDDELEG